MSLDPPPGAAAPYEVNAPYALSPDNRPAALQYSPLALTRDTHSQMSFGERAALEGVLAQVRPRVAIEIGTAEGGSLARIAAYSTEVHSIDLVHEPVTVGLDEHVHLHTGPSTELLPPLLKQLDERGSPVDFALVDGDHSFAGVVNDVRLLLASPTTARCVMLIHDSANAEVRAGIESIDFDGYEKVVYHEPDFVAGYMYRAGEAHGAVWGGFCLVICDSQRSKDYSPRTRQWRFYEPYAAIQDLGTDARAERERLAQALQVVYESRSWRLTAPLRAAARRISR